MKNAPCRIDTEEEKPRRNGIFGGLSFKRPSKASKAGKAEEPSVPGDKVLYTVVSGMTSVSDEVPSTSINGSGSVREGEGDTCEPSVGDLWVGGANSVKGFVAKSQRRPSVTTHASDSNQVPGEKLVHTSVMSGMESGSSCEVPCTSINGSDSVPEGDVDTSKQSMGGLLADGVGKVGLVPAKSLSDEPLVEGKKPEGRFGGLFRGKYALKPPMGDLSVDGVAKGDLVSENPLSDKPPVEVKEPEKGMFDGLSFKKLSKANAVEAPPVPRERVLYKVVSGMISVPDEVPSTSFDGSTVIEGKVDIYKPSASDLSADKVDDVADVVAKALEAPSAITHVADHGLAQGHDNSVGSSMGSSSRDQSSASIDGNDLAPAGEVGASKPSMGDVSAGEAAYIDLVAIPPEALSMTTHVASSAHVPANKVRYVVVSGMSVPHE